MQIQKSKQQDNNYESNENKSGKSYSKIYHFIRNHILYIFFKKIDIKSKNKRDLF